MKTWIAISFNAIFALLLLTWCHYVENPFTQYRNYNDVILNDGIKRGWIPEFLPYSATNIAEQHNIDTNSTYVKFDAPQHAIRNLKSRCRYQAFSTVKWLSNYPLWWPNELIDANEESIKYEYYFCGGGYLTWEDNTIYFWQS